MGFFRVGVKYESMYKSVCVCMHACVYVLLKQEGVRRSERERKKQASNQLGLRRKVSPQKAWDQYLVWAFCLLGFSLKCSSCILACLSVLELNQLFLTVNLDLGVF